MWYLGIGVVAFTFGCYFGWLRGYDAGVRGDDGYYRGWHAYRTTVPNDSLLRAQALYQQSISKQFDRARWWHGKYAIVKHENNQLRRKLFKEQNGLSK